MIYETFIAQYPAFSDSSLEASVRAALSLSTRLLDEDAWGDFFEDAVGLDAAHNLAIESLAYATASGAFKGTAGPVTSASAAGASASFASPPEPDGGSKADAWYMKTIYGQRFLRLRSSVISPGFMCS